MDRGASWATVLGVHKSQTQQQLNQTKIGMSSRIDKVMQHTPKEYKIFIDLTQVDFSWK